MKKETARFWELGLGRCWRWRLLSSGMWCRVLSQIGRTCHIIPVVYYLPYLPSSTLTVDAKRRSLKRATRPNVSEGRQYLSPNTTLYRLRAVPWRSGRWTPARADIFLHISGSRSAVGQILLPEAVKRPGHEVGADVCLGRIIRMRETASPFSHRPTSSWFGAFENSTSRSPYQMLQWNEWQSCFVFGDPKFTSRSREQSSKWIFS